MNFRFLKSLRLIPLWIACIIIHQSARSQTDKSSASSSTYNIIQYGAKSDGKTINTTSIQNAINECHKNGGGELIIPTGNFVTGTLRLYSNMNIYFQSGAVLTGSEDDKDYLYQKDFGFTGPGAGVKTGIFVAHDEQNISITGFGIINGNGIHFMYMDSLQQGHDFDAKYTRQKEDYMNPKYGRDDGPIMWKGSYEERPGVMAIFSSCKHITLSNIKFQESPNWTIAFLNSEDVKITCISIQNNMNIPNSDGIDFYDSKNITISDCFINAGDEAIAIVSSSHITASNCILHSRSCGIRVGYNVFNNNNSGDLLFNNISIFDSNRGIGIFQRQKGDMKDMTFSNIHISTRLHSGQWWGHGEPIHISAVPGLGSKECGSISNIRFSNITANSGSSGIVIFASEKNLIKDIYFDNIDLSIKQSSLEKGYAGNIDLRPVNNVALGIFSHSVPALFSQSVDNMEINHLNVHWGNGLPAYFNHAVECDDFGTVIIDDVHEQLAPDGKAGKDATIYLNKGLSADTKNITSTDKRKKLIVRE